MPDAERPRPVKTEAPYFSDDELVRLFERVPEFVALDVPNVYRYLFLTALKTGMRKGELLGEIDVSPAQLDLAGDVVEMLGRWKGLTASPATTSSFSPARPGSTSGRCRFCAPSSTRLIFFYGVPRYRRLEDAGKGYLLLEQSDPSQEAHADRSPKKRRPVHRAALLESSSSAICRTRSTYLAGRWS